VDPVRISKIQDFATPDGLAEKVLTVERNKEGVFEAVKISASESFIPVIDNMLPVYDIEYKIDSSRGKNRYGIRTTVYNKKLYVLTCQCKDDSFPSLSSTTKEILNSLTLNP